ncbi:MAG: class I SAM-dependent methyltransferase [Bacteroidales bacterium]|nr:class I SAM-dependent methyltransferase [Bacteroidales bacterium]
MDNKIRIEKNTVQETLMLPLFGKAWATRQFPDLFHDHDCQRIMDKVDYDFSAMEAYGENFKMRLGAISAAVRQHALVQEVKDYLQEHPDAVVVNLGCGLDTAGHQADNGRCRFVNIDFPNVIELREQLIPTSDRETNIASNITDLSWFDRIGFDPARGAVFFASGVLVYIKKEEVRRLLCAMAERFPGARFAFDASNKRGMRMQLGFVRKSGIKDVDVNFYLADPVPELQGWCADFSRVQCKRMNTDYIRPDRHFGIAYRLLAAYADRSRMDQLDVVDFRKKQQP